MIEKLERFTVIPYFHTYLSKVEKPELEAELIDSMQEFEQLLASITPSQLGFAYAPEKWTIRQVIGHCIETEIIFNYRALTIARSNSRVALNGFDENEYAQNMYLEHMNVPEMLKYAVNVRHTTIALAQSFSPKQMNKIGEANGSDVEVEALFYITSGHLRHHVSVIRDRYLG